MARPAIATAPRESPAACVLTAPPDFEDVLADVVCEPVTPALAAVPVVVVVKLPVALVLAVPANTVCVSIRITVEGDSVY